MKRCFLLRLVFGFCPLLASAQATLPIARATASSFMQTSNATYGPSNLVDGNLKTWWTPAQPASNGANSWVQLDLATETGTQLMVSAVQIHPGSHYPDYPQYGDLFKKNLRLRQAKLVFSDGRSEEIVLRDADELQTIALKQSYATEWIKLIPKTVYTSEKWNDLCISEFRALGEFVYFNEVGRGSGEVPLAELTGVYAEDGNPCQSVARFIYLNDAGQYILNESYLMDGLERVIQKAETYTSGGIQFVKLTVEQPYAERKTDTFLIGETQYVNVASDAFCADLRSGEWDWDACIQAFNNYLYQSFIAGVYTNEGGKPIQLDEDYLYRHPNGPNKVRYSARTMSSECGSLFIDVDGTEVEYGIRWVEGNLQLHAVACDEDGPDCWLAEKPTHVWTPN